VAGDSVFGDLLGKALEPRGQIGIGQRADVRVGGRRPGRFLSRMSTAEGCGAEKRNQESSEHAELYPRLSAKPTIFSSRTALVSCRIGSMPQGGSEIVWYLL